MQRRPERDRERRERRASRRPGHERVVARAVRRFVRYVARLAGTPARRAPGEEGAMTTRSAVRAPEEDLPVELQPTPQGGHDEIVREILGLARDAAVSPRGSDERLSDIACVAHRTRTYHPPARASSDVGA